MTNERDQLTMDMIELKKIRAHALHHFSFETAVACKMSYSQLWALVNAGYYPNQQQLVALRRYFHLEKRA